MISFGKVAVVLTSTMAALLITILVIAVVVLPGGADKATQPQLPELMVLQDVPPFLQRLPNIQRLGSVAAHVQYPPADSSGPLLVLQEFLHGDPPNLEHEPENPVRWIGDPSHATAYFRCGPVTISAAVFWSDPISSESDMNQQLAILKRTLDSSCEHFVAQLSHWPTAGAVSLATMQSPHRDAPRQPERPAAGGVYVRPGPGARR
jgi:hypothetical protein